MSTLAFWALKAANTLIMCYSDHVFCFIIRLTRPKIVDASLTLISRIGQRALTIFFAYRTRQYNHFGRLWLCSCLFAENVELKIIDALLMLNLMTYWQSVGAQQLYVNMHIVIIGSQ